MPIICRCESCQKPAAQCGPLTFHLGLGAAVCPACRITPNVQRIQAAHAAERSLTHSHYRKEARHVA